MTTKLKTMVKDFLRKRGYVVHRESEMHVLTPMLRRLLARNGSLYFIQIGANDGVQFDPLHDFVMDHRDTVAGLALEPIEEYYTKLVANYQSCPGVVLVKKAIHSCDEEAVMYVVSEEAGKDMPKYCEGISSFNKEHHERLSIPEEALEEIPVTCTTFDSLLAEYSVDRVDLVQIDAEGYDYDILMSIDFASVLPSIVRFETGLWGATMTQENLRKAADHLRSFGYDIVCEERDMTAYQLEHLL